jgi:hypothetical protein
VAKRGRKPAGEALAGFAEDLGRILGTAENKARGWLDQRKSIASQLAQVRDKADQLLRELTGGAANMAVAVTRSRGRPPGSGKKAKRKGRTFTAAQRKEQAERMRAYWAKRKGKSAKKKSLKKVVKGGGSEVGKG